MTTTTDIRDICCAALELSETGWICAFSSLGNARAKLPLQPFSQTGSGAVPDEQALGATVPRSGEQVALIVDPV
jgi:hypothetical protein